MFYLIRKSSPAGRIIKERKEQIEQEKWFGPVLPQQQSDGELARAAACYALSGSMFFNFNRRHIWPWDYRAWRPTNPNRDLEKAGALILAEMDRIK